MPFFKLLKKTDDFKSTEEAQKAFEDFEQFLTTLVRGFERKIEIFVLKIPSELQAGTSDCRGFLFAWLRLEPEDAAKKGKVGFDTQESFADVDEDSNVEDRVGVQVMKLDP